VGTGVKVDEGLGLGVRVSVAVGEGVMVEVGNGVSVAVGVKVCVATGGLSVALRVAIVGVVVAPGTWGDAQAPARPARSRLVSSQKNLIEYFLTACF
jgi:hypothetical protein